jgi:CRISPR/Cas system-associated exonuclease Cas4 (RecB family)
MLPSIPVELEPSVIPAAPPQPAPLNDFGGVLSPSQVRTFRDCGAKWYYKYALGLPDPPNGSLVRGRVVHQMAEAFFRAKLDGGSPDADDLQASFDEAWDTAAAQAAFGADEDVDLLKRQAAILTRKYLDEVAPEIEPAALELSVQGVIGGVPVRGFVDLLDTSGRIIDLKTAVRKPTGVSTDYSFQVATYRQLCPGANGKARVDTLVATKSVQVVTQEYTVSPADLKMTEKLYPLVGEAMREGIYLPNRSSNLCSYKHCAFAAVCEAEFGGRVKGAEDDLP